MQMRVTFTAFLMCTCLVSFRAQAQNQKPSPSPPPAEDVLRINTELVQTEVMVFDKGGKFVNGLSREQFELIVDGQPQPNETSKAGVSEQTRIIVE